MKQVILGLRPTSNHTNTFNYQYMLLESGKIHHLGDVAMSHTYKFQASEDVQLSKMDEAEIRKMVERQADQYLDALPAQVQAAQVNSVQLSSNPFETVNGGVWAQWTRACCDRRARIADFIYPEIEALRGGLTEGLEKELHQNHFDADFAVRAVAKALR